MTRNLAHSSDPEPKPVPPAVGWVVLLGVVAMAFVGIVAAWPSANGQVVGPDNTCAEAVAYHRYHAGLWSERDYQAYHLGAAEAFEKLGTGCSGWNQDATRPPPTIVSPDSPITTTAPAPDSAGGA